MTDANLPEPRPRLVRDWLLIAVASAAPLFWLGQLILGYFVSARACYPGDHPSAAAAGPLRSALLTFDIAAIVVALAAGLYAFISWRRHEGLAGAGQGATQFLALWAVLAALIFLGAIVFTTITSLGTPLCG